MTKLTKQEIKNLIKDADYVNWFAENVFQYRKNGKKTLVQDGKVLVKDVDDVWWFAKDVFRYEKDGKEYKIDLTKNIRFV